MGVRLAPDVPTTAEMARGVAVAGLLLAADVHLELWFEGYRRVAVIGPLFLVGAIGGLLLGPVALAVRSRLTAVAVLAYGAGTLAAFTLSVTVGLFGFHETVGGVPQAMAAAGEAVAVLGGAATLALDGAGRQGATGPGSQSRGRERCRPARTN